jgi:hypothetical protein
MILQNEEKNKSKGDLSTLKSPKFMRHYEPNSSSHQFLLYNFFLLKM